MNSNPTTANAGSGCCFNLEQVLTFTDLSTTNDLFTYYSTALGGGFSDSDFGWNFYGLQLYSGTEDAPTFVPGDYDFGGGNTLDISTLPSVTQTPEPSSVVLLGTGMLGVLGVVRRKFRGRA